MNIRIRSFLISVLLTSIAICASAASAAALPAFGNHDRVLTAFSGGGAEAVGVARDSRGRLIVAGRVSDETTKDGRIKNVTNEDIALVRYLPDGALDPSFGIKGRVTTDLGGLERATDVALDSQGRILVAGYGHFPLVDPGKDAYVLRYLSNGEFDPSFGKGGVAHVGSAIDDFEAEPAEALSLAVDRADRVVVGGRGLERKGKSGPTGAIARLTSAGVVDSTFGEGLGEFELPFTSELIANDVTIDRKGRTVIAARIVFDGSGEGPELEEAFADRQLPLIAIRFTSGGKLDPSFGGSGSRSIKFPNGELAARAVTIDRVGRILLAGDGGNEWYVARLFPNGRLDRSFARNGRFAFRGSRATSVRAIAVDSRNRVVLAGGLSRYAAGPRSTEPSHFALVRLSTEGRRDRHFGVNGLAKIDFGGGDAFESGAGALTIAGNTVYAAGFAAPRSRSAPPARFALARYFGRR